MMTNKWWTRDTSLTTEITSDIHGGETIVNDLPKKVKSVVGFGVGCLNWKYYVLWYSTCTYMCMSNIMYCTCMCYYEKNRTADCQKYNPLLHVHVYYIYTCSSLVTP